MSSKRMLGITLFGAAFIVLFIGVMLLTPYLSRDTGKLTLPELETTAPESGGTDNPAQLKSVEITPDNVQAVIDTLSRPERYTRDILIESYWDGESTLYSIKAAVSGDFTAFIVSYSGIVKRAIVTPDRLYTWNEGDRMSFTRQFGAADDWRHEADEWQMLLTYEDILKLPKNAITDAGRTEYGGEDCVYVSCKTGRLGYTAKYYVSVELGLLVCVEEYDGDDADSQLTYKMTTVGYAAEEPDESAFLLPSGSDVRTIS